MFHHVKVKKMAAKNDIPPQFLAEGVDKELTCAICISRLIHPKVLPCLHTYCKECLVKLVEKSRDKENITCPQCQETHPLPASGIDGFRTHFTLNNLLELLHVHDKMSGYDVPVISCESGIDEKPAVARCLTCQAYLCETCHVIHTKQKLSRDHTVLSLEEIKGSDKKKGVQSIRKKQYCTEHKDEVLKLFCKTCQSVICRDCVLIQHRDHEYAFISEVRQETQKRLEKLVESIKVKEKETQSHVESVEKIRQKNLDNLDEKEQEIEEKFKQIVANLEAHKAKLLTELRDAHQTAAKQIEAEADSAALALVRLSDSVRFIHQLLESGDDVEVMSMSQQAEQTLANLAKVSWKDTVKSAKLFVNTDSKIKEHIETFVTLQIPLKPEDIVLELPEKICAHDKFTFKVILLNKNVMMGSVCGQLFSVKVKHQEKEIPVKIENTEQNTQILSCIPIETGLHSVTVLQVNNSATLAENSINIDQAVMKLGSKVIRGPNWKWNEEDGGDGNAGTVIEEKTDSWVKVRWDQNNQANDYRWGAEGAFDLKIVAS